MNWSSLASGWKLAIILGLVLAIVSGLGGTAVYLVGLGESRCEAKQQRDVAAALTEDLKRLAAIGDRVIQLGEQLAAEQRAADAAAAQRKFETAKVIHENPLPVTCVLDPRLVSVRCESIQALYAAAGQPVPGQCPRGPEAPAAASRGKPTR